MEATLEAVPQSVGAGSYCPEPFAGRQWFKQGGAGMVSLIMLLPFFLSRLALHVFLGVFTIIVQDELRQPLHYCSRVL